MRLLNTSNFQLEEFPENQTPAYAILSHTWGKEEVLFADMQRGNTEGMAGYDKIRYSCAQAAADGLQYVWVDTCCIDRSSSAELSEAINSMYPWYQKAYRCYAYLADVHGDVDPQDKNSAFAKSRWFTRGWTLQELIAPSDLVLYSTDWVEIGSKTVLCNTLSEITGIDVDILEGFKDLKSESVAKRMSWASARVTTRAEDMAYCLMGLFNVNMPMLYGEGNKAFIRLQEKIMKYSDDHSLFAWTAPSIHPELFHGLLADSPNDFANSGDIVPYHDGGPRTPFSLSNKGLCIDLHLSRHEGDIFVAALSCPVPPKHEGYLGIFLKCLSTEDHQYARVQPGRLFKLSVQGSIQTIYARQSILLAGRQYIPAQHTVQLRKGPLPADGYKLMLAIGSPSNPVPTPIFPSRDYGWIPAGVPFTFKINKGSSHLAGALLLERSDGEKLVIMLGSTADLGVACDAAAISEWEGFEKLEESFRPQAPGAYMDLYKHRLRVDAELLIYSGVEYYLVDIFVQAIFQPQNEKSITQAKSLPFQPHYLNIKLRSSL
jgi:hypothetical protein